MPRRNLRVGPAIARVLRRPARLIESAVFDLSITGSERVPARGPVVIAVNHFSHLDPPVVGSAVNRFIRYLAVDELYGKSRIFDATVTFFGAIPLDRDGYPVRAMRAAIQYLHDGHVIGVFPEGRRVDEWGVDAPKRGAAWLAWMSGAPLVPVAIHGTAGSLSPGTRRFHRTAIRVWIEEPIWWYDYRNRIDPLQSMMDDWYERVDDRLAPWRRDD